MPARNYVKIDVYVGIGPSIRNRDPPSVAEQFNHLVKRLNKVWNSAVLHVETISRNDQILLLSRQLRFLGHLLRSNHALYVLYESPTHGKTRRGRPRTNYITYIQTITGHQLSELNELAQNWEDWHQLVVECADPQHPTRRRRAP